jgi:hypothetical protein
MTRKTAKKSGDVLSEAQDSARWSNLGNRTRSWTEMSPGEFSLSARSPLSHWLSLVVCICVAAGLTLLGILTLTRDGFSPVALEFLIPALIIWAWVVFAFLVQRKKVRR